MSEPLVRNWPVIVQDRAGHQIYVTEERWQHALGHGETMKNIQYDAEGDILSVTFVEAENQPHTGVELSDNIVLYFNPETEQPIKLILTSYRRMAEVSRRHPISLGGLGELPDSMRSQVLSIVARPPVANFVHLVRSQDATPACRLDQIFTPTTLQALAA
jgi:hypothetical protein